MNDDELQHLFSAFDDVSASDALQSSTLDFIMGAAAVAPEADSAAPESPAEGAHAVAARRGGLSRIRNSWHAMRVAAVAACLAVALTGGAAYAYPASTVLVTQGETTVEMHVNVFGQVLSASASDGETQDLIDELGLVHTQYADSVSRVSNSLRESNPAVPVEVILNGVTQTVDIVDEILEQQDDESVTEDDVPNTNDQPVAKAEAPKAEDEAPATIESDESVAIDLYVPEPSALAVSDGDSTTAKADSGKRSADREVDDPEPRIPDPDPDPVPDARSHEEADVAVEPIIVDEVIDDVEDVQLIEDLPADTCENAQDDEEVVYDATHPPKSHN